LLSAGVSTGLLPGGTMRSVVARSRPQRSLQICRSTLNAAGWYPLRSVSNSIASIWWACPPCTTTAVPERTPSSTSAISPTVSPARA
jgi:hypothetical protein